MLLVLPHSIENCYKNCSMLHPMLNLIACSDKMFKAITIDNGNRTEWSPIRSVIIREG